VDEATGSHALHEHWEIMAGATRLAFELDRAAIFTSSSQSREAYVCLVLILVILAYV